MVSDLLRREVCRIANGRVSEADVTEDSILFGGADAGISTLDLDSLDALELAVVIEERFHTKLPDDLDFKRMATFRDLVALVTNLIQQDMTVQASA